MAAQQRAGRQGTPTTPPPDNNNARLLHATRRRLLRRLTPRNNGPAPSGHKEGQQGGRYGDVHHRRRWAAQPQHKWPVNEALRRQLAAGMLSPSRRSRTPRLSAAAGTDEHRRAQRPPAPARSEPWGIRRAQSRVAQVLELPLVTWFNNRPPRRRRCYLRATRSITAQHSFWHSHAKICNLAPSGGSEQAGRQASWRVEALTVQNRLP